MSTPDTQSQPLREKLAPQTSIRFFMLLIAACALVMVLVRMAARSDAFWTKLIVMVIFTSIGCFLIHAILFLIANLMTSATEPIAQAVETISRSERNDSSSRSDEA